MLPALKEVLVDLWLFALGRESYTIEGRDTNVSKSPPVVPLHDLVVPPIQPIVGSQAAYVISDFANCLSRPVKSFDGVVGQFTYAQKVFVDMSEGIFAHVSTSHLSGWVEVSQLTDDKFRVIPQFATAVVYDMLHAETIKLRKLTHDEQLGNVLHLPLQGLEYMLFRLKEQNISIDWKGKRPRLAGDWQVILRGIKSITMNIEPKTGSVLESSGTETKPFLAYVESVSPDSIITITSVGRVHEGEFLREEVPKSQWIEWRPVFISFS